MRAESKVQQSWTRRVRGSADCSPEDAEEIESKKFNEAMFNTNLRLPKRERQPAADIDTKRSK